MAFHHVALAARDLEATHRFYTEAMGFTLVKMVAAPTPEGGWAKHAFYDTGGGEMIAFWELHLDGVGADYPTDLNRAAGLPSWVNHLALRAASLGALDQARRRWQACGLTVLEVDHEWCRSIYATDPNGITVEFCCTTRGFTDEDARWAEANIVGVPPLDPTIPPAVVHEPVVRA